MTFHRPIKQTCSRGHEKKQMTTGERYCPVCRKARDEQKAAEKRAAAIRKRIRPLYSL